MVSVETAGNGLAGEFFIDLGEREEIELRSLKFPPPMPPRREVEADEVGVIVFMEVVVDPVR